MWTFNSKHPWFLRLFVSLPAFVLLHLGGLVLFLRCIECFSSPSTARSDLDFLTIYSCAGCRSSRYLTLVDSFIFYNSLSRGQCLPFTLPRQDLTAENSTKSIVRVAVKATTKPIVRPTAKPYGPPPTLILPTSNLALPGLNDTVPFVNRIRDGLVPSRPRLVPLA